MTTDKLDHKVAGASADTGVELVACSPSGAVADAAGGPACAVSAIELYLYISYINIVYCGDMLERVLSLLNPHCIEAELFCSVILTISKVDALLGMRCNFDATHN